MATIDSDAHVVETDHTWDYMDPADAEFRPRRVHPEGDKRAYWFIDGKTRGLTFPVVTAAEFAETSRRAGRKMDTPEEARQMESVPARLRHMDQLGIDVQVLYPTIFIEPVADRPEVEIALCKSYNRWLADLWSQGGNRLRWACAVPVMALDEARAQMTYARDHGACAVFMRGIENTRLLHDPYFDPLYAHAVDLDMAIGVHIANGNPWLLDLLGQRNAGGTFWKFRLASVGAFHSVLMNGLPDRFPKLRMGFLEASAQWLPYVLKDVKRRFAAQGRSLPENPLAANRLYVSCQTDDDVAYLLGYAGEDNLVIGTDYGHNDQSTEIEALRTLRETGGLPATAFRKITDDNARALYGL